jgi:hypothetical protein
MRHLINAAVWIWWQFKNHRIRILHEDEVIVNKCPLILLKAGLTQFDINLRKKGMTYSSSAGAMAVIGRQVNQLLEITRRD